MVPDNVRPPAMSLRSWREVFTHPALMAMVLVIVALFGWAVHAGQFDDVERETRLEMLERASRIIHADSPWFALRVMTGIVRRSLIRVVRAPCGIWRAKKSRKQAAAV